MSNINNNRPLNISPMPAPEQQTQDASQTGTHPTTGAQVAQHPVDAQQSSQAPSTLRPKAQAFLKELEESRKGPSMRSDGSKTERKVIASKSPNKKSNVGNATSTTKKTAPPKPKTNPPHGGPAEQHNPLPPPGRYFQDFDGNPLSPRFQPSYQGSNYAPGGFPNYYPPAPIYPNPYYPAPHYPAFYPPVYPPVYPQIPQGGPHGYFAPISNQPMPYPHIQQERALSPAEVQRVDNFYHIRDYALDPSNVNQVDQMKRTYLFSWNDVKLEINRFVDKLSVEWPSDPQPSREAIEEFSKSYKIFFDREGMTSLFHLRRSLEQLPR
jgi:hypothetical protein